jgi:hypothetical protein
MRRVAVLLAVLATFATTATADAKLLVRYDVTGGLRGMSERLTVDDGGTARKAGRRTSPSHYRVSSKQLRALKRDLKAARFSSLKRVYGSKGVVNDGITQTVAYKGHQVSVSTGGDPPARLERLLRRLSRLMNAH